MLRASLRIVVVLLTVCALVIVNANMFGRKTLRQSEFDRWLDAVEPELFRAKLPADSSLVVVFSETDDPEQRFELKAQSSPLRSRQVLRILQLMRAGELFALGPQTASDFRVSVDSPDKHFEQELTLDQLRTAPSLQLMGRLIIEYSTTPDNNESADALTEGSNDEDT